jgi:hypothetical protein
LFEKVGTYFLSDPRGEERIAAADGKILNRIRDDFTFSQIEEIRLLITTEQSFVDLDGLVNDGDYRAIELFSDFESWLNNIIPQPPAVNLDHIIFDLQLYSDMVDYEVNKMFADWYPQTGGLPGKLLKLKNSINNRLRQDGRYSGAYLIDD